MWRVTQLTPCCGPAARVQRRVLRPVSEPPGSRPAPAITVATAVIGTRLLLAYLQSYGRFIHSAQSKARIFCVETKCPLAAYKNPLSLVEPRALSLYVKRVSNRLSPAAAADATSLECDTRRRTDSTALKWIYPLKPDFFLLWTCGATPPFVIFINILKCRCK